MYLDVTASKTSGIVITAFKLMSAEQMITTPSAPTLFLFSLTFLLASCWSDGKRTPEILANGGIYSAAFDEAGELALFSSIHDGAHLWHNLYKQHLFKWKHATDQDENIHLVAITNNGKLAATVSNNVNLSIWNAVEGNHVTSLQLPSKINQLAILDQNNTVIVALKNHTSLLIDITSGSTVAVLNHQDQINSVDLNANGTIAITGSADHSAKLWRLTGAPQSTQLNHNASVNLVKLSADGTLALTMARYDKAIIWDTSSTNARGEIPLSNSHLKRGVVFTTAEFSNDNQRLLTGTAAGMVQLWNLESFKLDRQWRMPKRYFIRPNKSAVLAVAFGEYNDYSAITTNGLLHWFN